MMRRQMRVTVGAVHVTALVTLFSASTAHSQPVEAAPGRTSLPPTNTTLSSARPILPGKKVRSTSPLTFRASVGVAANLHLCDSHVREGAMVYPQGKLDIEAGVTFEKTAIGLTASVQLTGPLMRALEAGPRLSRDWWLTKSFGLTPTFLLGGVYVWSADTDEGGYSAGGVVLQAGLLGRFRFDHRVGIAVRILDFSAQLVVTREGLALPLPTGLIYQHHRTVIIKVDLAGFVMTCCSSKAAVP
jgi:hypothetical protein